MTGWCSSVKIGFANLVFGNTSRFDCIRKLYPRPPDIHKFIQTGKSSPNEALILLTRSKSQPSRGNVANITEHYYLFRAIRFINKFHLFIQGLICSIIFHVLHLHLKVKIRMNLFALNEYLWFQKYLPRFPFSFTVQPPPRQQKVYIP